MKPAMNFSQNQNANPNPVEITHGGKQIRIDSKKDHAKSGNCKAHDLATPDLELDFVPLSSLPPAQAVFSIEKIRKWIFSYSSTTDLLQFRRVSPEWRQDATNEILSENRKSIKICVGKSAKRKEEMEEHDDDDRRETGSIVYAENCTWNKAKELERPLQELTQLLDATGSNPFPCCQFKIYYNYLCKNREKEIEQLETFLTRYGARIKQLELNIFYGAYCLDGNVDENNHYCHHKVQWLIYFVQKLLLDNLSNLLSLDLDIDFDFDAEESYGEVSRIFCQPIPSIATKTNYNENSPAAYHLKLKSINVLNHVGHSVLESFCRIAPNLKELQTDEIAFFLEPINRLHLLKELKYTPGFHMGKDALVKRIAYTEGQLMLKNILFATPPMFLLPETKIEIEDIFNKLMERSCQCLEQLQWYPLGFLPELNFPVMPKVRIIKYLSRSIDCQEEEPTIFPPGICVSEKFPYAQIIRIQSPC